MHIVAKVFLSSTPSIYPSVYSSIHPSIRPFMYSSIHQSICPSVLPFVRPSVQFVHPSIRPTIHPCIHPPCVPQACSVLWHFQFYHGDSEDQTVANNNVYALDDALSPNFIDVIAKGHHDHHHHHHCWVCLFIVAVINSVVAKMSLFCCSFCHCNWFCHHKTTRQQIITLITSINIIIMIIITDIVNIII